MKKASDCNTWNIKSQISAIARGFSSILTLTDIDIFKSECMGSSRGKRTLMTSLKCYNFFKSDEFLQKYFVWATDEKLAIDKLGPKLE